MLQDLDIATARSAVLFSSLPQDLSDDILRQATSHKYDRGKTIFVQGDTAQSIYVVLDGWVKLFRLTTTGAEAVVGVFTKGGSFGEAVALEGTPYPVSAETVTDCRLLTVRAATLSELMHRRPEVAMAIVASTFRHLHGLVAQIEALKAHTGAQRVAEFLLELCVCETGSCTITLPYDKTLIAGRLGMQPQSLSRAFNRLEAHGVKITQNMAAVADIAALRQYMMDDRSAPWRKVD